MIISFKITILLNITIYIIILKSNIFLIYLLFSLIFPAIHVIEKSHYWCFTEETLGITVSVTKISRNKFGGAAIITGRRQVRGGGREKEREVRMTGKREPASERKKDIRSLSRRSHLRILFSRFCIFHLGEYVRSAASHFRQETFYR